MRRSPFALLFCLCAPLAFLSGCSSTGSSGIRIIEGQQDSGATPPQLTLGSDMAQLVHVDLSARLVTIRDGGVVPDGFLVATGRSGQQTAILKALPLSSSQSILRTAYILEGEPQINDIVHPASAEQSSELAIIYRDSDDGND